MIGNDSRREVPKPAKGTSQKLYSKETSVKAMDRKMKDSREKIIFTLGKLERLREGMKQISVKKKILEGDRR